LERADRQERTVRKERTPMSDTRTTIDVVGIEKLSKDIRDAAKLMGKREIGFIVSCYYDIQAYRIASANQQRKLLEGEEPSAFMGHFNAQLLAFEKQMATVLDKWSAHQPMGVWAREIVGIGPIIASGLCAHIDIEKAPSVGHIWRFAGLDPTSKWEKGKKRPWNAALKRILWLAGESFVKVSGNARDTYGKLYLQRKEYEIRRNEAGELADFAKQRLSQPGAKKLDKGLIALLETGKLPAIAMHERSKRWAVKMFLSHWWEEAYRQRYGSVPPAPYPIAHLGHIHKIEP